MGNIVEVIESKDPQAEPHPQPLPRSLRLKNAARNSYNVGFAVVKPGEEFDVPDGLYDEAMKSIMRAIELGEFVEV